MESTAEASIWMCAEWATKEAIAWNVNKYFHLVDLKALLSFWILLKCLWIPRSILHLLLKAPLFVHSCPGIRRSNDLHSNACDPLLETEMTNSLAKFVCDWGSWTPPWLGSSKSAVGNQRQATDSEHWWENWWLQWLPIVESQRKPVGTKAVLPILAKILQSSQQPSCPSEETQ